MNIVFWLLIVILAIVIWFCLMGIFRLVGKSAIKTISLTKNIMIEEDEESMEDETE